MLLRAAALARSHPAHTQCPAAACCFSQGLQGTQPSCTHIPHPHTPTPASRPTAHLSLTHPHMLPITPPADAAAQPIWRHAPRLPPTRVCGHAEGCLHAYPGSPGEHEGVAAQPSWRVCVWITHGARCTLWTAQRAAGLALLWVELGVEEHSEAEVCRKKMWNGALPIVPLPPVPLTSSLASQPPPSLVQGMLSPQAAGEREGQKRRAESPIPEDGEWAAGWEPGCCCCRRRAAPAAPEPAAPAAAPRCRRRRRCCSTSATCGVGCAGWRAEYWGLRQASSKPARPRHVSAAEEHGHVAKRPHPTHDSTSPRSLQQAAAAAPPAEAAGAGAAAVAAAEPAADAAAPAGKPPAPASAPASAPVSAAITGGGSSDNARSGLAAVSHDTERLVDAMMSDAAGNIVH